MKDGELSYTEIRYRFQSHGVFRFLRKERAAFLIAFLIEAYKRRHRSDIPQGELVGQLAAFAEAVRIESGEEAPAIEPQRNLDEWADEGILRKYYLSGSDEARYDLTPEAERAIGWVTELTARQFVGTESRLLKIFDLLKELVFGASLSLPERIAELERRRAEIDQEIDRLRSGSAAGLDATKIRERYFEVEDTARRLLADFKQVEHNFRDLDRRTRAERLAAERSRGSVLKEIFELRDRIMSSDQGRSFSAFWAFLMSAEKQDELSELVQRVSALPEVSALPKGYPLELMKPHLVEAGARVQRMTHRINEELRHFLDEQSRREGRRVAELVEEVRRLALKVRDDPPPGRAFLSVEGDPDVDLIMERPLFHPELVVAITERPEALGSTSADTAPLYEVDAVDLDLLRCRVRAILRDRAQASLAEVAAAFPLEQGVAELLGYYTIASQTGVVADREAPEAQMVLRNARSGRTYWVHAPNVIFLPEMSA